MIDITKVVIFQYSFLQTIFTAYITVSQNRGLIRINSNKCRQYKLSNWFASETIACLHVDGLFNNSMTSITFGLNLAPNSPLKYVLHTSVYMKLLWTVVLVGSTLISWKCRQLHFDWLINKTVLSEVCVTCCVYNSRTPPQYWYVILPGQIL